MVRQSDKIRNAMSRISKEQQLANLHAEALTEFDNIQSALRDERLQCLQDRRFYSLAGSQWEGPLADVYENKPKFEVNKIHLAVIRIINEYRNNRITVDFVSKDGESRDKLADTLDGLYRADEQDSVADEAYDNAFEESVGGGIGAWRLRTVYEDDEDPEDDRQRIRIEPIFDADSSVFFDLEAKRQDKSDAKRCFVITAMTREAYKDAWGDDPSSWPKVIHQYEFDWCTPDVVYVAEYYRVEEKSETVRIYRTIAGDEERYTQADFDNDENLENTLQAIGSVEVRRKKIKTKRVHKYIMSGGRILEDAGYIAGKCIPIIVVYGKRWFVDNVERCMGHVRLAKDAQRLKNMQLSKLGEISALSSVEKPILTPEQVAGHQVMWSEDNLKDYPYLLINPVTDQNGNQSISGPVAYTRAPNVPPAMAALLQVTEQDMQEILGSAQQADKMVSNISGKAVEMIQQRLDMQTFIYMSNFSKGMKRCGEVWLSMAKDIYTEERRKMKAIAAGDEVQSVELMKPVLDEETGAVILENDISNATFDVNVEVGPSSSSKRSSTVRALTGMMAISDDPETKQVLQAMAMLNMEGEGISDVRDFFRKKLVRMGVVEPTEKEAEELMAIMQGQNQPDPNAIFLQASAEEAIAKAEKARAETVLTIAKAQETKAKTLETLANVEGGNTGSTEVTNIPAKPDEKTMLEIEALRLEIQASQAMQEAATEFGQSVSVIGDAVGKISDAVGQFANVSSQNAEKAIAAISKPKRIIREKGRISRIETEE